MYISNAHASPVVKHSNKWQYKIKISSTQYNIKIIAAHNRENRGKTNTEKRNKGRLPLLSARPAVTLATLKRAATNFAAW